MSIQVDSLNKQIDCQDDFKYSFFIKFHGKNDVGVKMDSGSEISEKSISDIEIEKPERVKLNELIVVQFVQKEFKKEDFDEVVKRIGVFMAKFLFPRVPEENEFVG